MKKLYIKNLSILIVLSQSVAVHSQVGIGTTNPDASAILEMNISSLEPGKKKGFLLPRVSLKNSTDQITVPNPAKSLWVYNINSTSGANSVEANTLYFWDGTYWDAYASTQYINSKVAPADYFIRSYSNYTFSTSSSPVLSQYNSGTLASVPWETGSVVIDNPEYIVKESDNSTFKVNVAGYYDISGFVNYNPIISDNSKVTTLQLLFQTSEDGNTWTTVTSTNSTFEKMATNTIQSITIPYQVLHFENGSYFRFALYKPSNKENHGNGSGIMSSFSTISTKSFHISYLRQN